MTGTEKLPEPTETQIVEQISAKIAAGDADGATFLAFVVLTRIEPLLKDISERLQAINQAIAPDDRDSPSVALAIRGVSGALKELVHLAKAKGKL
jgi:hypothetical protein